MKPYRIGVLGKTGRMGSAILKLLEQDEACVISAAEDIFSTSDVVIDFTNPAATDSHVNLAVEHKIPIVIGTTGLSEEQKTNLTTASQNIPILWAANMSFGIAILSNLVKEVARLLDVSFDIEINEIHHRHKIDAPSGTALSLGEAAARGRSVKLSDVACYTRHGNIGPRPVGQIGFSTGRGGTTIGEHTVRFLGDEESIELTHKGYSRDLYAKGAIRAAKWLVRHEAGLYQMSDVLSSLSGWKL